MTAAEITHHPDCDEWRIAHPTDVARVYGPSGGPYMWQASCRECGWRGQLRTGTDYGKASATTEGRAHGDTWVACDGRCADWDAEAS